MTAPTLPQPNGAISAKGRYRAASDTTSHSSLRYAPSGDCWPNSRASMPSIALKAMRTNIHAGNSRNSAACPAHQNNTAPSATESDIAARVTALALTPRAASRRTKGRNKA